MRKITVFLLLILCTALACAVGMAVNAAPIMGRANSVENYQANPPITSQAITQVPMQDPSPGHQAPLPFQTLPQRETAEIQTPVNFHQRWIDSKEMRQEQRGLNREYKKSRKARGALTQDRD